MRESVSGSNIGIFFASLARFCVRRIFPWCSMRHGVSRLSLLARHCIILNALCISLAVMAVCIVYIEPLGNVWHGLGRSGRRELALCVFYNGSAAALNLLNLAFYPKHTAVNLFVVSSGPVQAPLWSHGKYQHVSRLPLYDGSDCLILLDDTMEVSPVFIFWFIHTCNHSVVSGGETGLALSGKEWQRFAREGGTTYQRIISTAMEFISKHNITVVYPDLLDKGYTFVRSQQQSPIFPEQMPKLARGMQADFFAVG